MLYFGLASERRYIETAEIIFLPIEETYLSIASAIDFGELFYGFLI